MILVIILLWITGIIIMQVLNAVEEKKKVTDNPRIEEFETAVIMENNERTGDYSYYDVTDTLAFFSYSDHAAQVDAYNHEGDYQFSIVLANKEKGAVTIRCHNNLLYITSKYNNIFVFDGRKLVQKYSALEKEKFEYNGSWWYDRSYPTRIFLNRIYRYDAEGNIINIIRMPDTARYSHALSGMAVLFLAVGMIFKYRTRKTEL